MGLSFSRHECPRTRAVWYLRYNIPNEPAERWRIYIKQTFHCIRDPRRYIFEPRVVHPVPRGILREWKLFDAIFVDVFWNMKENAEGSLRKNGVCRMQVNMVVGKVLCRIG
jgi:hypothetical protein